MKNKQISILNILVILIIIITMIITIAGVFYNTSDNSFFITNQFNDVVEIYGKGIYSHDSSFKAPINKGTDLAVLVVAVPFLIIALIKIVRKKWLGSKLFLTSILSFLVYYSASISFGVVYNQLFLLYICLFSLSFFSLILSLQRLNISEISEGFKAGATGKGEYIFLFVTGIALFVAWIPDIIVAFIAQRPIYWIGVYTTEITYILDMGIISPLCFICFYLLKKKKGWGYILLDILLTNCLLIGIILPFQTFFQLSEGVPLSTAELITKVSIFCLLAFFALFFKIKLLRNTRKK